MNMRLVQVSVDLEHGLGQGCLVVLICQTRGHNSFFPHPSLAYESILNVLSTLESITSLFSQ